MTTKELLKAVVPLPAHPWLSAQRQRIKRLVRTLVGGPASVSLRRTTPVSSNWGWDRGQPVDRFYIMKFLEGHADDVRGHVLEFAGDAMTCKLGGDKVTKVDVLDLTADNPRATIIGDLALGENIPSDTFDCVICTQVLFLVYGIHAAVRTLYRILKPGGIVLVTTPGVAHKVHHNDIEECGDYWRFTALSLHRLFAEVFPAENIEVKAYGNVLVAIAALHGFAVEDLRREDLDYYDPEYQVSITLRAVKPVQVNAA